VARPGDRISADYNLVSEIRRFEIDAGAGQAVVEVSVKMVRESGGSIAAGRVFEARSPAVADAGGESIAALDLALGYVLRDIAGWAATIR
jgi:cholesterol transport system auxiliary component